MKIYRVVCKKRGLGFYMGLEELVSRRVTSLTANDFCNMYQPEPYDDPQLCIFWEEVYIRRSNYRFGFNTKQQLRSWFNNAETRPLIKKINKHFNIITLEGPRDCTYTGDAQCIYEHAKFVKVDSRCLSEIDKF